jgi:hypothetical protein
LLPVLGIADSLGELAGLRLEAGSRVLVARDRVRPRQRLVREREVPVLQLVGARLAIGQAPVRVVQRRLAAPERRVDARDLPLAAREVGRGPDLAPVVARRVCCVDQLVVLLRGALG